jgi:pterin-4a-carbinolamine dehydratase
MKKSKIPQNWQKVNDKIQRNFEFDTFERSIEFVNRVAQIEKD